MLERTIVDDDRHLENGILQMDLDRIFAICAGTPFRTGHLTGNFNLSEFEVIFWDPSTCFNDIGHKSEFPNDAQGAQRAFNLISSGVNKLYEWCASGRTLIVYCDIFFKISYSINHKSFEHLISETRLFEGVTLSEATGRLVEYCGPAEFIELVPEELISSPYTQLLSGEGLIPLLRVSGSRRGQDQVVAAYRKLGDGLQVLIQRPLIPPHLGATYSKDFFFDLARLCELKFRSPSDTQAWATLYTVIEERAARAKRDSLLMESLKIQAEIKSQEALIARSNERKILFEGTGDRFCDAVAKALHEIGFKVEPGPRLRADLIAYDQTTILVIEAKGVEGSAKESHLRQCNSWVAEVNRALVSTPVERASDYELAEYARVLARLGVALDQEESAPECKGLMVVGGYRKTPLALRTNPVFPPPLQSNIAKWRVCACSGLQLFGMVEAFRVDNALAKDLRTKLMMTNGALAEFDDWQKFLTLDEEP